MPSDTELALRRSARDAFFSGAPAAFLAVSNGETVVSTGQFEDMVAAVVHSYIVNSTVAAIPQLPLGNGPVQGEFKQRVQSIVHKLSVKFPLTMARLVALCDLDSTGNITVNEYSWCMSSLSSLNATTWFQFMLNGATPAYLTPSRAYGVLLEWTGALRCIVRVVPPSCLTARGVPSPFRRGRVHLPATG